MNTVDLNLIKQLVVRYFRLRGMYEIACQYLLLGSVANPSKDVDYILYGKHIDLRRNADSTYQLIYKTKPSPHVFDNLLSSTFDTLESALLRWLEESLVMNDPMNLYRETIEATKHIRPIRGYHGEEITAVSQME